MINWDAVGAIGETVGALAVVITLVYLAVQIRQNTKSIRASTYQSVAEALADSSYKLVGNLDDADSDRRLLFMGTIRRYENLHFQLRHGNIAEEDAQAFFNSLALFLSNQDFGKYWVVFRGVLDPAFVEYIEEKVLPNSSDVGKRFQESLDQDT